MLLREASVLDCTLELLDAAPISNREFHALELPNGDEVLGFLLSEGMLEQNKYGIHITPKGSSFINEGGYTRRWWKNLFKTITSVITLVAALATIVNVLFSFFR